METSLKITIIIGLAIVLASGIYVANNCYQTQKKDKQAQELAEQLNSCLTNAESKIRSQWNTECRKINKSDDCNLPLLTGTTLGGYLKDRQDICFKKYK